MNVFPSFTTFNLAAFLASWKKLYLEVFSITLDPERIALPPVEEALGAGVVMHPDVTIEHILAEIKKRTVGDLLWRYTDTDLDTYVQKDSEAWRPAGVYAVWVYPATEATEQAPELTEKSYDDIQKISIPIANFREYTMLYLWHLVVTGTHLDTNSWTLSSSLDADGGVLLGLCDGGRFGVDYFNRHDSGSDIRARRVVLPLKPKAAATA
mgnify:CR=1 FL=1